VALKLQLPKFAALDGTIGVRLEAGAAHGNSSPAERAAAAAGRDLRCVAGPGLAAIPVISRHFMDADLQKLHVERHAAYSVEAAAAHAGAVVSGNILAAGPLLHGWNGRGVIAFRTHSTARRGLRRPQALRVSAIARMSFFVFFVL